MMKLTVFDWNGTILSDTTVVMLATQHEFDVIGMPAIPLSRLRENFEIPIRQYHKNMGLDEATIATHSKAMHEAFQEYYEKNVNQTKTRPGARVLLDKLQKQGVAKIILSNHHVTGIQQQLKRLKLDHYFEAILANDDIYGSMHMGKAARLEKYLKASGINPKQAVIIGDTSEEIIIGRSLGLKTVAVSGGMYSTKRLKAAKPDVLVSSLNGLIDVVEGW